MQPYRDEPASAGSWHSDLDILLTARLISGYALMTVNGVCAPVGGALAQDLQAGSGVTHIVKQFLRPFNTSVRTESFCLAGRKLLVVHATDASLYALARQRRLGVAVAQLPFGIVVVTFGPATHLQIAVHQLEAVWDRLRR